MRKTVVIVGGGFSGALTAINLAQLTLSTELTIYLIDVRGTFGPGLAYSPPSERFKLNVRTKAMGAFPADPEEFFRWLKAREPVTSPEDFAPRLRYGEYLTELVERAAISSHAHKLVRVADEVTDVTYHPSESKFQVELRNGPALEADACVFAVGNQMQTSLGGMRGSEIFRQPFLPSSYDDIAQRSRALIVGSSLTAVDVIMETEGRGFTGDYTVVSRNGRLPLAHETFSSSPTVSLPNSWESVRSTRKLLQILSTESRRIGSSQPVFDMIRPKIQTMWTNLPPTEKTRFLRHARPLWDIHRHRIPGAHAAKLRALQDSGRLTVIAGRITATSGSPATMSATITPRGPRKNVIERDFDVAFMCAGMEGDLTKTRNPLLLSLLSKGLISAGPLKLGSVPPALPVQSLAPPLWVIGPLQREERWEITAVRELREEALLAAREIADRLSPKNT